MYSFFYLAISYFILFIAYLILHLADNAAVRLLVMEYFYINVLSLLFSEIFIITVILMFSSFMSSSSETAWSPRCAVEKTRLRTMRPPLPSPKLRLHLSPPARWPPLDLYPLLSPQCPICPCTPRDPTLPSSTTFYWPILLTYLSMCLHCSGTTTRFWWDWHHQEPPCVFSIHFNYGKSSAGLTEFNPAPRGCCLCDDPTEPIPSSPLPKTHIIGENLIHHTA